MFEAEVHANEQKEPRHGLITLLLPLTYPEPMPGQFIMLRLIEGRDPLLKRPFSVCNFERGKENVQIEILYRVVGQGTEIMSRLRRGDRLTVSAPVGQAFEIPEGARHICLVAGGVGVAPLLYLARFFRHNRREGKIFAYVGGKTKKEIPGLSELKMMTQFLTVSTEDGTLGYQGLVTDAFRRDLEKIMEEGGAIYGCGPRGMIRSLAAILDGKPVFCQVSMEERMACGMGACLGCAVALKGREGRTYYGRACVDGPVFSIERLVWEGE